MWVSFYLDGWVSVFVFDALPSSSTVDLPVHRKMTRSSDVDNRARGPPTAVHHGPDQLLKDSQKRLSKTRRNEEDVHWPGGAGWVLSRLPPV